MNGNARSQINIYAQLADLKNVDYRNTLAIATLIDLLTEKGVIDRAEFAARARHLDGDLHAGGQIKRNKAKELL
ncbi:MAG TPA: nitrile hydratase subunit beta [Firmicutes bacterium]|nr:nitrile hydratase subunit beta [Bacillota bacterium]